MCIRDRHSPSISLVSDGSTTVSLTSGSTVTVDTTLPTIDTLTISSNNPISTYAKLGNTITLNIGASESISTPSISFDIGNITVNPTVSGSNDSYTATHTVSNGENGSITNFNFSNIIDLAGNLGTVYTDGWTTGYTDDFTGESYIKWIIPSNFPQNHIYFYSTNGTGYGSNLGTNNDGKITINSVSGTDTWGGMFNVNVNSNKYVITDADDPYPNITELYKGREYWFILQSSSNGHTPAISLGSDGSTVLSLTSGSTVIVDTTAPTISSITVTSDNATTTTLAKETNIITFKVGFSETIVLSVASDVKVPFTIDGGSTQYAIAQSTTTGTIGGTENAINFNYTVPTGVNGDIALVAGALTLDNDSTIKDIASNPLIGNMSSLSGSMRVDTTLPSISSITPSWGCLLYTSPSPRDDELSRMPSSA